MGNRIARTLRATVVLAAVGAGAVTSIPLGAGAALRPTQAASPTVWLCRPGQTPDPCAWSRAATAVTGSGATRVVAAPASPSARRFDCFYVYPTVSTEPGTNADLTVQPAERAAAVVQASRFSQHCTVWAPMYRQVTVAALGHAGNGRRGRRVHEPAGGLEGLPRARQPRPAHRLHRAFAGLGHAHQAPPDADRPLAGPAQENGVRHPPRRECAGPARAGGRRHLPQHPCLQRGRPRPVASSPIRLSDRPRPPTPCSAGPGRG